MKRPTTPKQEDCCGSGCNPCIFDVYEKQLKLYESSIQSGEHGTLLENAISQTEYTSFYVVDNIDLENEHKLILLKQYNNIPYDDDKQVVWEPGDHFLLKFSSKQLNFTRAYTPLKIGINSNIDDKIYDFAVLVKRYCDGAVSNHLCDLNLGDVTLWRGPYGHYKIMPNTFHRIIMIAQGTGITPLYSIIKKILKNEDDMTKITLLFCCKNIKSILLRDELYSFKSYWNFNYEVYLSDNIKETCKYKEPIIPHKLNFFDNLNRLKPCSQTDQFLLCGSTEFVGHFKQLLLVEGNVNEELIVIF